MRTVKCYNIVHKALMISSYFLQTSSSILLLSSGSRLHHRLLNLSRILFFCLEEVTFWVFVLFFLSNNALLTLMVPYASDSAPVAAAGSHIRCMGDFWQAWSGLNCALTPHTSFVFIHSRRRNAFADDVPFTPFFFLLLLCFESERRFSRSERVKRDKFCLEHLNSFCQIC